MTWSPFLKFETAGADLFDDAHAFVAEDEAVLALGDVALEDVQVAAADRDAEDSDDRGGWPPEHRLRCVVPALLARPVINECFHDRPPSLCCASSGLIPGPSCGACAE
jgi:hypothetical protein